MTKFVIAICTLCIFAAVSAWIMGGETGKYSTSISIDASPGDVFPYLTDGEKIAKWAEVVRVDSFSEDESVTRTRVTVNKRSEEVLWEDSILRFQTGENPFDEHAISIRSVDGGNVNTYFFQLRKNEVNGTNIEYRVTQTANGLDRFLFPFRKDTTKSRITSEITKLKSLIESEVEPADPSAIANSFSAGQGAGSNEEPLLLDNNESAGDDDQPELAPVSKAEGGEVFKPSSSAPRKEAKKRDFDSLFGSGGN